MTISVITHANFVNATISETVTAGGNSAPISMDHFGQISITITISAVSGAAANIQFCIEASDDGISWNTVHDTRRFTAAGAQRLSGIRISGRFFRFCWLVNGTTPSITFTASATLKNYSPVRTGSLFRYDDLDLKTSGAVSTVYGSLSNTEVSLMVVRSNDGLIANASIRVQASNDGLHWGDVTGDLSLANDSSLVRSVTGNAFRFYRTRVTSPVLLAGTSTAHLFWASTGGA